MQYWLPNNLEGTCIQVHDTCHQDVSITITSDVTLIPLMGNGTVACMCD